MTTGYAIPMLDDAPRWYAVVSDPPREVPEHEVEAAVRAFIADRAEVAEDSFALSWTQCGPRRAADPATYARRITGPYTRRMSVTTVEIQSEVRDRLARIAAEDYPGASLSDVLARLLAEHENARTKREIVAAYARLRSDPDAWADYVAELQEWDAVTGDGSTRE